MSEKALAVLQPLVDKAFESLDRFTEAWLTSLPKDQQYAVAAGLMYQQINNNGFYGWLVVNDYARPTINVLWELVKLGSTREFDVMKGIVYQTLDYIGEWDTLEYDAWGMGQIDNDYYDIEDAFLEQVAELIQKL